MSDGQKSPYRASPGDRIIIHGHRVGEAPRDAEVLEVLGDDGAPPYRVRWEDGHEAEIFPGSDVVIHHFEESPEAGNRGGGE